VPKKCKFLKNIEKTPFRRVAQKRYNFAPGAVNFFDSHFTFFDKTSSSSLVKPSSSFSLNL